MSAAEKSIREELESAMAAQAETLEQEPVEAADAAPEVEPEVRSDDRPRDEKGRFVAKAGDAPAEADEPAQAAAEPAAAEAPEPAAEVVEASPQAALAPPNGWPAEAKAKWHELPQEVMQAVQKREQDVAKFTSTRDEHASFGKEMYQAVSPYLAVIKAEGGTPRTAVESLLNTAYLLRTGSTEQKKQLLLQTARQFGVDLGQPAQGQANGLPPELTALQQRINQLESQLTSREQAEHQRIQSEVQSEIEAFAADPKHAHYQEVKAHMAALLREGAAKDLQDAYDQAVWANPSVRATLQAQQRAEEEQKRREEAKARAEAAKRKSVGITGGPGNTAAKSAPEARSLREELETNFATSSGVV